MNISPIKTESDYDEALKRFEILFDSSIGTLEGDEAEVLAILIDEYENKHFSIEAPDPIEAIKIRMEELNLKGIDMIDSIGGESTVSAILNKRRKLTVEMIRNLTIKLNLSPKVLINDYPLRKRRILYNTNQNSRLITVSEAVKSKSQHATRTSKLQVIEKVKFNNGNKKKS
ncbi:transcriptional regulator [Flavobacterium sp.]|uniref:helix-turn-helix domain-containing protein n=1 Tax=Flavobacterium sp. TaxID=239 RepID=UPI00286CE0BA|nr:transcriptional regulator [Flavobacterium sp.]